MILFLCRSEHVQMPTGVGKLFGTLEGMDAKDRAQMRRLLVAEQEGLCAICKNKLTKENLDHCHVTGLVRAVLCSNCNNGLGHFKDSPYLLREAIRYVGEWRELHDQAGGKKY